MKLAHTFPILAITASVFAANAPKIAPKEAAQLVAAGQAVLVDCREPAEYAEDGVATPAVLLPKSDFDGDQKAWNAFLAKNQGKQIILYCRGGTRAAAIANALQAKGLNAANLGGLKDWTKAGLPTRTVTATK